MKTTYIPQVAVLGGGSWATAIVKMLSQNALEVNWWLRSQNDIQHIKVFKHNPRYLSSAQIDLEKVHLFNNVIETIQRSEIVVLAIPSAFLAEALKRVRKEDWEGKIVVSAIKGMVAEGGQNLLISEYMQKYFEIPIENILFIAGPCHAEEVALERLSYLTICGLASEKARFFSQLLKSRFLKTSILKDLAGAEYCAVMKNIIAVACGIAHGLNYGDNFQAVLVPNALQEIRRFLDRVCPSDRDLSETAYLGDLLVTAYSQFSRNRTLGNMVGRGYSVRSAMVEMGMVAEGYYAVKAIHELNNHYQVDMPVTKAIYMILYERISPIIEFQILREGMK